MSLTNKKLLLSLGGVLTTSLGLASFISCGAKSKESKNEKLRYSNIWNTHSAEKQAMTRQHYQLAKKAFDVLKSQNNLDTAKVTETNGKMKVSNPDNGKYIPVVFMDIDETVLNNFAYQNWMLKTGEDFTLDTWEAFVRDEISKEIHGAFDFIKHVWSNGGVVMFNSNREQKSDQLEATRNNLVKEGLDRKYLPNWVFWMQGVDLSNAKPWSKYRVDEKGKRIKSYKEERMNMVSDTAKSFDASEDTVSGNALKFRVIMRVGDNYEDFNDLASKGKVNAERNKVLEHNGKLFGNMDPSVKGVKFTSKENPQPIAEEWSESYIMIGGNSSYGGWEEGIAPKFHSLSEDKQKEALNSAMEGWLWTPKK